MVTTVLSMKAFPKQPGILELELDCLDRADEGKHQKVTIAFDPSTDVTVNGSKCKSAIVLLDKCLDSEVTVSLELPPNDRVTCKKADFTAKS